MDTSKSSQMHEITNKQILALHQVSESIQARNFWNGIAVWHRCPHTVNRILRGSVPLFFTKVIEPCDHEKLLEAVSVLNGNSIEKKEIFESLNTLGTVVEDVKDELCLEDEKEDSLYIVGRKLIPKDSELFSLILEIGVLDKRRNIATYFGLKHTLEKKSPSVAFPFSIEFTGEVIRLSGYVDNIEKDSSSTWLKNVFFHKFCKWVEESDNFQSSGIPGSMKLVPVDKYSEMYQRLKMEYGKKIEKMWTENTDPKKFVYEDIAIASYLILLWEQERVEKGLQQKQSFVDLGCGNGLLVYILSSEGHPGLGLDVRKRKIWDMYPSTTQLQVTSITPSDESLYPGYDWLIGNHSDELTPWIPVIAAKTSFTTRFFLLPCCTYDFNRKYQRIDASKSQYFEYLNYVRTICDTCGFKTDIDKLRIPSTRRVCIVGRDRTYKIENTSSMEANIKSFMEARCKEVCIAGEASTNKWVENFQPREAVEKVRNCTQLNKELIDIIVQIVVSELLKKRRLVEVNVSNCKPKLWNSGGVLEISEVAKLIPRENLKQLKSECGGLQTLLKNNHNIFFVQQGRVQFRMPSVVGQRETRKKILQSNGKLLWKQKPCWFFTNHPDGCPLLEKDCSYKHNSEGTDSNSFVHDDV